MLRKLIAGALLVAGALCPLAAQSNDRLDELLAQSPARLDSTAYLLLAATGQIAEDAEPSAAFDAAVAAGLIAKNRHSEDPVSIEDLSYFVMKTQKLSGGLEWMFLPSPRGAYRELAYRDVINTSGGPRRLVAGDEVVRTLNAVVALKGGHS